MELAGTAYREMNSENSFSLAKSEVCSPLMVTERVRAPVCMLPFHGVCVFFMCLRCVTS